MQRLAKPSNRPAAGRLWVAMDADTKLVSCAMLRDRNGASASIPVKGGLEMAIRKPVVIGAMWVVSLVGVAVLAQNNSAPPRETIHVQGPAPLIQREANGPIISGDDLGFQPITGSTSRPGQVAGKLMVRINGEWHEVVAPAAHGSFTTSVPLDRPQSK